MIKCKREILKIKGAGAEVLAELGVITEGIVEMLVDDGITRPRAEKYVHSTMSDAFRRGAEKAYGKE